MKQFTFRNFEVGIVDNSSIETQGGFEFASGIDIFSEPGVAKASFAMTPVSGLPLLFTMPRSLVTGLSGGVLYGYVTVDRAIYESTDGINWTLFLTSSLCVIDNLAIYNGYIFYTTNPNLGRCPIHTGQSDTWQTLSAALR
jgi:hypothetical protein